MVFTCMFCIQNGIHSMDMCCGYDLRLNRQFKKTLIDNANTDICFPSKHTSFVSILN